MKRLLNSTELVVNQRLQDLCEEVGGRVFPKVRLADVLPIEGSGIPDDLFRFALQSHFDFVVTDDEMQPLFATEFDGPGHRSRVQQFRDAKKNELCERFGFALLRINSRYLSTAARGIDLLTWLIESWFNAEAFFQAQERGDIPYDEPFSPTWIARAGDRGNFPYQIASSARRSIRDLWKAGRCKDMVPSNCIGKDGTGRMRAVGWMRVTEAGGVIARTGARWGNFRFFMSELMDELIVLEMHEALRAVLDGEEEPVPYSEMERNIQKWTKGWSLLHSIQSGGSTAFQFDLSVGDGT